jgi:hypothetical protein
MPCEHKATPVLKRLPDNRGFMREHSTCPECGYYVCHCGCGREINGPYR